MRLLAIDVGIDRGDRRILSGVTFSLASGEALLVTGDNGTGKSSLLRVLAGFLPPSAGSVRIDDADESVPPFHYLGHRDALKAPLTTRENLAFAARYLAARDGGLDPETALAAHDLGAAADSPVAWLSSGQRRRVALARLLVAARPLWLLDEPTVGLDARSVARFEELARQHLTRGGLIVAATHVPLAIGARELRLSTPRDGDAF